ncbi:MAG: CDP-alcohol phosphatidyltransferase family protein [Magnetococcales bacterium]|nr:CDP-alcohol phosphatidyltransferase family protein [Magnetococcales bacterium]
MKTQNKPILTPNQITLSRLVLTVILFILWFATSDLTIRYIICAGFAAIFVADAWDGLVARKYNLSSLMGIYLDPVVDVISYSALCLILIDTGLVPLWFFFVYFLATSLAGFVKQYAAAKNRIVSASILAKVKADLVSVPLAGWFVIQNIAATYQPWVIVGVAVYLFGFKFLFDPDEKHTFAIRTFLLLSVLLFIAKPEHISLPNYYGEIYLIIATIMHVSSSAFYFWDNRSLFMPEDQSDQMNRVEVMSNLIHQPEGSSIE